MSLCCTPSVSDLDESIIENKMTKKVIEHYDWPNEWLGCDHHDITQHGISIEMSFTHFILSLGLLFVDILYPLY